MKIQLAEWERKELNEFFYDYELTLSQRKIILSLYKAEITCNGPIRNITEFEGVLRAGASFAGLTLMPQVNAEYIKPRRMMLIS